jgi:hypothetical protein
MRDRLGTRLFDRTIPYVDWREACRAVHDLESSLRQTAFLIAGRITTAVALIYAPRREVPRVRGNPELLR